MNKFNSMWQDDSAGYFTIKAWQEPQGYTAKIIVNDGESIRFKYYEELPHLIAKMMEWSHNYCKYKRQGHMIEANGVHAEDCTCNRCIP